MESNNVGYKIYYSLRNGVAKWRRLLTSAMLLLAASQICLAQYDYTLHFDSYVFRSKQMQKSDTIRRPATVYVSRSGSMRFVLTGKGTYVYNFSSVRHNYDEGPYIFFLPLYFIDNVEFINGNDQVVWNDSGELSTRSVSSLPEIVLQSQESKTLYTTIRNLAKEGTFMSKGQQKTATATTTTATSNKTMLCLYDGGYFIRDGLTWYEYRPSNNPTSSWATYKQYHEEEAFYNLNNSKCSLSIPKNPSNNIFISRNGKWEVVYYTRQIFDFCPQRGNKLFCHTRGFFFKDGNQWKEYLPEGQPTAVWSYYTQSGQDAEFYYLKNDKCQVAVPRKAASKFFIKRTANASWTVLYETTQIFDY